MQLLTCALEKRSDELPPDDDDNLIEVAASGKPAAAAPPNTPTPAPAASQTAETAVEPQRPKHSKATLRLAADFGLSQEEIDGSSAERLDERVDDLWRWHERQRELDRGFDLVRQQQQAAEPSAPARADTPPSRAPAPLSPAEPEVKVGLREEDGWDKNLIAELRSMKSEYQKELAALKAEIGGFKKAAAVAQQGRVYDTYDAHFAKYPEIYGKGTRRDKLPEHELRRREFVIEATKNDPGQFESFHSTVYGLANVSAAPPPEGDKQRDANGRFAKPAPAPEPAKSSYSTEDWEKAALRQPSQRVEAPATGVAAAKKAFRDGTREIFARDGEDDYYQT